MAASATGQGVTVNPETVTGTLRPNQKLTETIEVCLSSNAAEMADIYFLADVTGTMSPVINQVKTDAVTIVSTLLSVTEVDIQIGVGQYKDFPFDHVWQNQVPITNDQDEIINQGINKWFASGGHDGSEGQFWALRKVATDPGIGFRAGASRILVWFGDAPGHDPICDAISGAGFDITEASVTADLVAANITVIAISVPTGAPLALNADPKPFSPNYEGICVIGGAEGQADRIAAATFGTSTFIADPADITDEIFETLGVVLSQHDVALQVQGAIAPYVTSIVPPSYSAVVVPIDPLDQECVTFDIEIVAPVCADVNPVALIEGEFVTLIDGVPEATTPISVAVPDCAMPTAMMFLGLDVDNFVVWGGSPNDVMQMAPLIAYVLNPDPPVIPIPTFSGLQGLHVYMQAAAFVPFDDPGDAIKVSQGLDIELGVGFTSYGAGSGLTMSLDEPPDLGGQLVPSYALDP